MPRGLRLRRSNLGEIVQFELGLTTAQIRDNACGIACTRMEQAADRWRCLGQSYYPGSNDVLGGDPTGEKFSPSAFSLFTAWENAGGHGYGDDKRKARAETAAGEKLFNSQPVIITGVRGLNDNSALGSPASIAGTCTTCHDTPNVGNHSVALPLDIAISRQREYETNSGHCCGPGGIERARFAGL